VFSRSIMANDPLLVSACAGSKDILIGD